MTVSIWIPIGIGILLLALVYASVFRRNLASLRIQGDSLIVELRGLNKVWALKSHLVVPLSAVIDVRVVPSIRELPVGFRLPGTAIPFLILAGSYRKMGGEWSFYAVRRGTNAVLIELSEGKYQRIVVETRDPHETVARLEESLLQA